MTSVLKTHGTVGRGKRSQLRSSDEMGRFADARTHVSDGDRLGELEVILLEGGDLSTKRPSDNVHSDKASASETHESEGELGEVLSTGSSSSEGVGGDRLELESLVLGDDEGDACARVAGVLWWSERGKSGGVSEHANEGDGIAWSVL